MVDHSSSYVNRLASQGQGSQPRAVQSTGQRIMELAEKLRPTLQNMFEGCRDENGMPVQAAKIRAIALNLAQNLIKHRDANATA